MKRRQHKRAGRTAAMLIQAASLPIPLPPPDPAQRRKLPGATWVTDGIYRARTTLTKGGDGDIQVGVFRTEVEASNASIWAKATFGDEKHQTWALRFMYERDAMGLPYEEPSPLVRRQIARTLNGG